MSESTPIEEQGFTNVVGTNIGSGNLGQSNNGESLIKTVKFNLSEGRCGNYFKNNLRGDANAGHKEHKLYNADKRAKKLFEDKIDKANVFDQDFPGSVSSSTKTKTAEYRHQAHYVNGNLKTHVQFDHWAAHYEEPSKKVSRLKPAEEIAKEVPQYKQIDQKPKSTVANRVRDVYGKDVFKDEYRELNQTRADNIEKYLGSSGVRSAILKTDSHKQGMPDKIVNMASLHVQNMLENSEKPKNIKTARHMIINKQVVYQ